MSELRILLVEDDEGDLKRCKQDLNRYKANKQRDIKLVECETLDDVLKELENPFDGVIIDLQLTPGGDEGKQVIRQIRESLFRIPIFIFTGRPEDVDKSIKDIEVFTKANTDFYDLLDELCETYDTGFTRILGGDGKIEELLGKVFLENLLLQRKKWVSYGKTDLERTENALLRYTLNHLLQLLDEDEKPHFREEFYLYPHVSKHITTGSIVREKTSNQPFVVLSPACDLVIRQNGTSNTDHILLVEIESMNQALDGSRSKSKVQEIVNNKRQYLHWLPQTDFFEGGVLNFRKLKTLHKNDFKEQFEKPSIQTSPFFIKDIVSRFSSCYARQGQPEIDSKAFVDCYTQQQS
jgi:CheY-like chemotaxis protein